MTQEKIFSHFWPYRILPKMVVNYLELIRFEKPVGFLLLMWPCWFALAIFSEEKIKLYLFFLIGAFCMRGVGCIINDYFDRYVDIEVKRTKNRPLADGRLNTLEAFSLMVFLLIISLIILIQLNIMAIVVALVSIPLIIIYPLMKRYTYWPQLILGITFSWGVFVASAQVTENISLQTILLYIACIFWTLGYDTIYSYQDREDDIKLNIKSTAILFNNKGKNFVKLFYGLFVFILLIIQNLNYFQPIKSLFLIGIIVVLTIFLNKWDINSRTSCNKYFKYNNYFGLLFFLYLLIFI